MTRLLLRILNTPALILLTLIGIAIQSSLFSFWIFHYIQPDVALLVIVWVALRRDFTEGGMITLIIGNICEIHSASPQGYFMIIYMMIYLAVRGASHVLVIPHLSSYVLVGLIATFFSKIIGIAILGLLGTSTLLWQHILLFVVPGTLINGLVGHWVFQGLEKFDWVTFKNIRAEQALEDELQLELGEN